MARCYDMLAPLVGTITALLGYAGLIDVAMVGFVNLDNLAGAAQRREIEATAAHGFDDAVVQEPSGVVFAAERAL